MSFVLRILQSVLQWTPCRGWLAEFPKRAYRRTNTRSAWISRCVFSVYQWVCLDSLYKFEGIQFSTLLRPGFLVNASKESSHPFFPCVCQEDCAVQNVWLMGGLSVLTSVSTTPQPVCLLCASKGRHEVNDAWSMVSLIEGNIVYIHI